MTDPRRTVSTLIALAVGVGCLAGLQAWSAAPAPAAPPSSPAPASTTEPIAASSGPSDPIAPVIEPANDSGLTVEQWSQRVWDSALHGDGERLQAFGQRIPDTMDDPSLARVRAAFAQYRNNETNALAKRDQRREEAVAKLHTHTESHELSQALKDAVEIQAHSGNINDALTDPEITALMATAVEQIRTAEKDGDWLLKQELLYRLRTLYEDTDQVGEYDRYKELLEQTNRRVALLAEYAPHHLYELRIQQAKRLGEEDVRDFNPALAEDWREHIKGIDHRLLWPALQEAASEHIEAQGWRPLIEGGLKALRIFATTPALSETFPNLGDQEKVARWLQYIDTELEALDRADDNQRALRDRASRIIHEDLPTLNTQTLDLPRAVLYRELGDGAMGELDEYSELIWPFKFRRFTQATQGHFVGVGILIRNDEKRDIVVVNPLEGSPAYFAGIKPEDRIVQVDGQSTVGWSLNDAVDRITGKPKTQVTLGLKREGVDEVIQVQIIRDQIKLHSVYGWWKERLTEKGDQVWNWYVDPVSRIAYIKLSDFSEETPDDLKEAWNQINRDGAPRGLVLDLRYNPGGLLSSAVEIANLFVENGLIVKGEDKDHNQQWAHEASPNKAPIAKERIPTVVLVNKGSASASEIVAGALQAHGAAVIVGERSYGKGSVQTVHQMAKDSLLKLTTQYYRLPPTAQQAARGEQGRLVHKRPGAHVWGVDPDIVVEMTPDQIVGSIELRQASDLIGPDEAKNAERPDINGLLTKGLDPQLETALLLLQVRALRDSETRQARLN